MWSFKRNCISWELRNAQEKLDRSKKSRIELLHEASQGECVMGCDGQWLFCALEILEQNGIKNKIHKGIAGQGT